MKTRILALLLALAMGAALAGCSNGGSDPSPSASPSASAEPSADPSAEPSEEIVADLSQDVLTFAAGELAGQDDLLTVNGKAVPTDLMLYWLAFSCAYFESTYAAYGITVADYADGIFTDATTMAAYYTLLQDKAAENGCPLTDAQLADITAQLEEESGSLEQIKALWGLEDDDLEFLYSVNSLYSNLLDALVPVPTEEELNNYVYQARHILLLTVDMSGTPTVNDEGAYVYPSLDEETVAEKKALAEELLGKLKEADDLDAAFNELMNEYSEDSGLASNPDGYTTTVGKMVAPFEQAALSLKPGEISGIVESTYGYHIILRGEVEDLDSYAGEYRENRMDTIVSQWLEETDIQPSDAFKALDVNTFYRRYAAWQEAWQEANPTADPEPSES